MIRYPENKAWLFTRLATLPLPTENLQPRGLLAQISGPWCYDLRGSHPFSVRSSAMMDEGLDSIYSCLLPKVPSSSTLPAGLAGQA